VNITHPATDRNGNATSYGCDAASRLQTVSDGNNPAAYSCLANSPLVIQTAYATNGITRMPTGCGGKRSDDMRNMIIGELFSAL